MQAGGRETAGCCCWSARLLDKFGACQDGVCMALAIDERASGRDAGWCSAWPQQQCSRWDEWLRARRDERETRGTDTRDEGGRQAGMAVLSSRCTRPHARPHALLPQAFEKTLGITLPAVPAPLIARYGHACTHVQSRPARSRHHVTALSSPCLCPVFARSQAARPPGNTPEALARLLDRRR